MNRKILTGLTVLSLSAALGATFAIRGDPKPGGLLTRVRDAST